MTGTRNLADPDVERSRPSAAGRAFLAPAGGLTGRRTLLLLTLAGLTVSACQPTVRIEAPDRPIEINLNIRIEQEVRLRIERDLEEIFAEDPDLFGLPTEGME